MLLLATMEQKLYESLGFKTFGVQERSLKYNGQYWDEEHMVLFLDENNNKKHPLMYEDVFTFSKPRCI